MLGLEEDIILEAEVLTINLKMHLRYVSENGAVYNTDAWVSEFQDLADWIESVEVVVSCIVY